MNHYFLLSIYVPDVNYMQMASADNVKTMLPVYTCYREHLVFNFVHVKVDK